MYGANSRSACGRSSQMSSNSSTSAAQVSTWAPRRERLEESAAARATRIEPPRGVSWTGDPATRPAGGRDEKQRATGEGAGEQKAQGDPSRAAPSPWSQSACAAAVAAARLDMRLMMRRLRW